MGLAQKLKHMVRAPLVAQADLRTRLELIIVGIVIIVVGFVTANIAYGFSLYILQQLNTSIGGSLQYLVNPTNLGILGTAFIVAGILLVIVAVAEMIMELRRTTEAVAGRPTGA